MLSESQSAILPLDVTSNDRIRDALISNLTLRLGTQISKIQMKIGASQVKLLLIKWLENSLYSFSNLFITSNLA